jgi:hypothetical protein
MQKRQIDNYDMFLAVENHFDDNPLLWNTNVPITTTKTLFSSKIDGLATQVALQLVNPTGITADKDKARTALEDQAFSLSSAVCGYASVTGKGDLYKRCHYTKSDLLRFRDAELLGVCTNLAADCNAELANLAPYGVTAAILTTFNTALTAFGAIMKNPVSAIAKRKGATEKIEDFIVEIADILNTRMDNLIVGLTATQPAFVETYNNLRTINATGSNQLSLTITTLNAVSNDPIPNVNLELVGEGITRVSSERGYNTITNLVAGSHQIKAMHPNYKPKTETFTVVTGETTELVLLLETV